MEKREEERAPFNERAALEELERFKSDIERYRQERKAVGEQFEQFVKSFKAQPAPTPPAPPVERTPDVRPTEGVPAEARRVEPPPTAPAAPPPSAPPPAPAATPAAAPASAAASSPPPVPAPAPPVARTPPAAPSVASRTAAATRPAAVARAREKKGGPGTVLLLGLLLLAAGIAVWFFWPRILGEPASERTATTPAAAPAPQPQPAQPAPQAAAPAVPADETVLTTIRPVWLRVIADGKNVLERELPAGGRFPFKAEKTVVIRTGDAGAVRLTLNGKDLGPLGTEGQVVTRSFTVQ